MPNLQTLSTFQSDCRKQRKKGPLQGGARGNRVGNIRVPVIRIENLVFVYFIENGRDFPFKDTEIYFL